MLAEGKGDDFLPLFQLLLLSRCMGCHKGTLDPHICPSASAGSSGTTQAVGASPQAGDLLLFIFLLGFGESSVESEELFYRHAYQTNPWIYAYMYLRESE